MFHGSTKTKYCWIGGLCSIRDHRHRFGFNANAALPEEVNAAIMGDAEQPWLQGTTVVEFVELSIGLKECLLNHIFAVHYITEPVIREPMFSELMPVLQNTIVTLTISRIDDQLLRVNIIPIRKTDKESDAENALSKPLTVTAPPAELDQDFVRQVLSFSRSYERSAANIREIEEAHAAAVKAAEEERKNEKARKSAAPAAKTSPRSENDGKAAPGGKPVFGSKGQSATAPAPATQSLFETPAGEAKGARGKDEPTSVATVVEESEPQRKASALDGAITSPVPSAQGVVETGSSSHPVEEEICEICKYPILPHQERHPLMPVPAHASAMDCETARRQVRK